MNKKRVLLIEDDHNDIALMHRALIKGDFADKIHLIIMCDGKKALNYLSDTSQENSIGKDSIPDLILLDLHLSKLNGFEILKSVKSDKKLKYIPIIVLTSSLEKSDLLEAYHNGANSYIQKPLEFNEFRAFLEIIIKYWLTINVSPLATNNI
jgi:two-component system response regulator